MSKADDRARTDRATQVIQMTEAEFVQSCVDRLESLDADFHAAMELMEKARRGRFDLWFDVTIRKQKLAREAAEKQEAIFTADEIEAVE